MLTTVINWATKKRQKAVRRELIGVDELLAALEEAVLKNDETAVQCPCGRLEWAEEAHFDGGWWCRQCQ